jgi:hypothetical protein
MDLSTLSDTELANLRDDVLEELANRAAAEPRTARVVWIQHVASGRRTSWAKTVVALDMNVRGVKAFAGEYLQSGVETDLRVGSFVLEVRPMDSVKHGWEAATLSRVMPDGELEKVVGDHDWRKAFLSFRDAVALELQPGAS